jgi:hypothetical protein
MSFSIVEVKTSMWRKRKWIIISVLAAIVVIVVGVFAVAAYAQTSSPTPTPAKSLAARVAAILGIDQAKVESAITQAQKETRDEALNNRLQELVKAGKLTQDQADKYKTWINSRPNVPAGIDGMMKPGPGMMRPGMRGPMMGGPGWFPGSGTKPASPLPSPSTTQ